MERKVLVTGMALLSPLGNSLDNFWKNSLKKAIGYKRLDGFEDINLKSRVVGRIQEFKFLGSTADEQDRKRMGRPTVLAINAAIRAIDDAQINLSEINKERSGVCIANAIADTPFSEEAFLEITKGAKNELRASEIDLPLYEKGMFSFISIDVAHEFGFQGANFVMSTGCTGGIDAVGYGLESIQEGEHDVMICGASEAPISSMTIASFDAIGALAKEFNDRPEKASRPFDAKRCGFVLSEGCAVVVLEEAEHAFNRGATVYGEVSGFVSTNNSYHMTDLPDNGDALSLTMDLSLNSCDSKSELIDYINAHGSSTQQNDLFETAAYKKTFKDNAYSIPISSTKSMTGHPLAAASAIEIVHSFLALNRGYVPPTANLENPDPSCDLHYVPNEAEEKDLSFILTNASGFSGIHSAMIISKARRSSDAPQTITADCQ